MCRVHQLDHRPDAVALYSECTLGKGHAWFLPDNRHTVSIVGLGGGSKYSKCNLCPPLQYLKPVYSKSPTPIISSSVSTASKSTSSTQENLLPCPSTIIPTMEKTETRYLTTPDKFNALSTENLPEAVPTTSNSEQSNAPKIPQCVKRNSINRRKRPKVQKPEIEIKMAPHRPRKSAPTEFAIDEENMITYDVEEKKLEPDPTVKFALKEGPTNYTKGYLRALTPSRFRKSRS
ncbi:hypothetical protein TNCV_2306291 [Trichonephila clavipes]|nr:hypothetical protein TNCV_2306291 [Trichonephila clavipes]